MTNPIRALLIAITAGFAPCVALQVANPPTVRAADDVSPGPGGRYLVEFEAGSDPYLEAGRLEALGIDVVEVYTDVFDGVAVRFAPDVVDVLRGQPFVKHVEADQVLGLDGVESSSVQPTTVQAGAPWGLDRLDQRSLPLSSTYSYNSSGAGVTAYIIDSGISALHTDFGGRVRSGFTTITDGRGTGDCNGHGTHVAGIVGGQVSGVAKSVSLVAVRVLDCTGTTTVSQLLNGLNWVIADHQAGVPAVANISIGGGTSSLLDAGVQAVITDGVTVAVAAGNETQNVTCNGSPARAPAALTVAASAQNDARAAFSNFGSCVDLFAPGVNIPSADFNSTTQFVLKSGTSMASPHVAGAAAVLLSERPTWTPAQVARDLIASATFGVITDPMGSPNVLLFASPNAPPDNDQFDSAATIDVTGSHIERRYQRRRQHRTRGTGSRAEQRWNVGVVDVHRPRIRHGDAVDGRIDVRHHARGLHRLDRVRAHSRRVERRAGERQQPHDPGRGRSGVPRGRRRRRRCIRDDHRGSHVDASAVRVVGPGTVAGDARRDQGWRQRTGCSTGWVFAVVVR